MNSTFSIPRRALAATAALAVGAAALALGVANGGAVDATGKTIDLTMRPKDQRVTLVDNPPMQSKKRPFESHGDHAVLVAPVRDGAGEQVGRMHAIFTVAGGRKRDTKELVQGTLALRDGHLVFGGMIGAGDSDVTAVLGGTGAYAGTGGTMTTADAGGDLSIRIELGD